MSRAWTLLLLLLLAGAGSLPPACAAPLDDAVIQRLEGYRFGGDASALDEIARHVAASRSDPAARAALARQLASVLTSSAAMDAKQFACRQLVTIASEEQVPALASLLTDDALAHYALLALAAVPGRAPADALLKALPASRGRTRLEIMDTLAARREARAVPVLAAALQDPDAGSAPVPEIAEVAAFGLARIGGPEALQALREAFTKQTGARKQTEGDALLKLAQSARGAERPALQKTVAALLEADASNPALQAAALRLRVEAHDPKSVPLLLAALGDEGSQRQKVAASLARQLPGANTTRALAGKLGEVPPHGRVLLIEALAERGDTAAARALAGAARDPDAGVRLAALRALGPAGDASAVEVLLRAASVSDAGSQAAARASLVQLRAPEADARLTAAISAGPAAQRVEAIRAAGERRIATALPALLTQAAATDAVVRPAALRALRDLAGPAQLSGLIGLLLKSAPGERDELIDAVAAIASRSKDENERTGALLQALSTASKPADRSDLLAALAQVGGPRALESLRKASTEGDPDGKLTAIRLLAEWQTDEPMPDLLRIARESGEEKTRTLALRGYLRMAGLDDRRSPAASVALYRQVAALVTRPDEKRQVLAGLGKTGSLEALEYASSFLADEAVRPEAELAVLSIGRSTAGAYPQRTRAAAEPIARTSASEETRAAARSLLAALDRFGDYVTAWEVSPAYERAGAGSTQLFDLPFPPEEPNAAVPWRLMPAGTNPEQPWLLDLLALLGGEQRVAYLRTAVYSATPRDVVLELGSDDGVKAWWNGQVVLARNVQRGVAPAQEKVTVALKPGWNHLTLKITQNVLGWGAVARFANPDGTPATGLRYEVPSSGEVSQ